MMQVQENTDDFHTEIVTPIDHFQRCIQESTTSLFGQIVWSFPEISKSSSKLENSFEELSQIIGKNPETIFLKDRREKFDTFIEEVRKILKPEFDDGSKYGSVEYKRVILRSLSLKLVRSKVSKQKSVIQPSRLELLPTEILLEILEGLDNVSLISILDASDLILNEFQSYSSQVIPKCSSNSLEDPSFINYFPSSVENLPWIPWKMARYQHIASSTSNKLLQDLCYMNEIVDVEEGVNLLTRNHLIYSNISRGPGWHSRFYDQVTFHSFLRAVLPKGFKPRTILVQDNQTKNFKEEEFKPLIPITPLAVDQIINCWLFHLNYEPLADLLDPDYRKSENTLIREMMRKCYRRSLSNVGEVLKIKSLKFFEDSEWDGKNIRAWGIIHGFHPSDIYKWNTTSLESNLNSKKERKEILNFRLHYIRQFYYSYFNQLEIDGACNEDGLYIPPNLDNFDFDSFLMMPDLSYLD